MCAAVCIERRIALGTRGFTWLENVGVPGNVGSGDQNGGCSGSKAVLLSAGCADYTSPKVIRSTMEAPFTFRSSSQRILRRCRKNPRGGGTVLAAALDGDEQAGYTGKLLHYDRQQEQEPDGAGEELADINIRIPIFGDAESLNAGIRRPVLMYRAIWH